MSISSATAAPHTPPQRAAAPPPPPPQAKADADGDHDGGKAEASNRRLDVKA